MFECVCVCFFFVCECICQILQPQQIPITSGIETGVISASSNFRQTRRNDFYIRTRRCWIRSRKARSPGRSPPPVIENWTRRNCAGILIPGLHYYGASGHAASPSALGVTNASYILREKYIYTRENDTIRNGYDRRRLKYRDRGVGKGRGVVGRGTSRALSHAGRLGKSFIFASARIVSPRKFVRALGKSRAISLYIILSTESKRRESKRKTRGTRGWGGDPQSLPVRRSRNREIPRVPL